MADIATLGLRVDGNGAITTLRDFAATADVATARATALESRLVSLSAIAGLAFGGGLVGFAAKFVRESIEAQNVTAQLETAIKSTGGAAQRSAEQMDDLANAIERTTTFSDEAIKSAETMLTAFDNIRGDTFDRATRSAADLAARMGGDVVGAAQLLGRALQEPDEGLAQLNRRFRLFSEAEQDAIKDMVNAGQSAHAQTIILDALQTKFGGAAEAARNTLGGALKGLANDFGDLFEVSRNGTSGLIGFINAIDEGVRHIRDYESVIKGVVAALGTAGLLGALTVLIPLINTGAVLAFLSLAKSVTSLAEAFALLQLAIPGLNIIRGVILALSAAAGLYVYWRDKQSKADEQAAESQRKLQDAYKNLVAATGPPPQQHLAIDKNVQKQLADMQGEIDKQHALNAAYAESEISIKLLTIQQDAAAEKRKEAVARNVVEIAAINATIDARARELSITARLAEVRESAEKATATAAQFAAADQAIKNETALAAATALSTHAAAENTTASEHRWAQIAIGSQTTQGYIAASKDAASADVTSTNAARDREKALALLAIQQQTAVASTAAYVTFQKESLNATAQEVASAKARYDAAIAQAGAQRFLKTALVETTDAANRQADADARIAANTAFTDSVTARVKALNLDTEALLREAAAQQQGRAAVDALAITMAGEAAVRELVNDATQKHIVLTQDEIDAVRRSAEAHEGAAIAVAKLSEQQKLLSQPLENFIKNTQADIATAFSDIFTSGGTAAQKFWSSFRDLAFKTLGEIAAVNLEQKLLGKATGIGATTTAPATQYRADGTPLAPGSGAQTIGSQAGISTADQQRLGYFALAAAGVTLVADAMNTLIGTSHQTVEALNAQIQAFFRLEKGIAAFTLEINGSTLDRSVQAVKDRAQALRDEADAAFPGKRLQAEREGELAKINALEAQRIKQLQDEFAQKQKETIEDYNIRALRATGLGAEADAATFAAAQTRELNAAIKEFGKNSAEAQALKAAQDAEAAQRARDIQTQQENRARDLGVRQVAATGGTDRQVDDLRFTIAQERELADLRKTGTQAEIDALVAVQALEAAQRAADFAALEQRTREDYAVRQLQAEGHTAEAAALRLQLDQQREYQDAVKAGLDDATLAALALAQAAEGAAAAAKQAQDAQRALDDLQVRALTAQGDTAGADQLRFQLQQQRELEDALAAGRSQEYIDKLKEVQALEAKARADAAAAAIPGAVNRVAGPQASGETTAIANAAKVITSAEANRMADYLSSILIVEREQLNIWKALAGMPTMLASPRGPVFDKIDTGSLERWAGGNGGQGSTTGTSARTIIQVNGPLATIQVTQLAGEDQESLVDRIVNVAVPRINEELAAIAAQERQRDGNPLVTDR